MKIVFTDHAKRRMGERSLSQKEVREFVTNPDSSEPSTKDPNRFLIKKVYYHRKLNKRHLLMAICEREVDTIVVVTVIDTSQIQKYI